MHHTPILTAAEMREADRLAVEKHHIPSTVLMENAARNTWLALRPRVERRWRILILCGGGNNGGDGIALARHALIDGYNTTLWLASERLSADAQLQLDILRSFAPDCIATDLNAIGAGRWDVVVDAMLGTGAQGGLREPIESAARWMNGAEVRLRCALDIPTGLDADTGRAAPNAARCDLTVTMAALKPGLLLGDGPDFTGEIVTAPIGAPQSLYATSPIARLDDATAASLLPETHRTRHKYERGLVVVIGGAPGMRGAGVLGATSALNAGAGVVKLIVPAGENDGLPWPQLPPEVMLGTTTNWEGTKEVLGRAGAIVLGSGIGRGSEASALVRKVLEMAATPVVLDADGFFPFGGAPEELVRRGGGCELVLTPHYGEAAHLLGRSSGEIADSPLSAAHELAQRTNTICVLKGAATVVATPEGRWWIASAGNPGMATAGSGDVLAGTIGACIAQRHDALGGTLLGVHLHGSAGDVAGAHVGVNGMVAGDIVEALGEARRRLEELA